MREWLTQIKYEQRKIQASLKHHREEKNMMSSFCLRISLPVRARPVFPLESILISYSPILFCLTWPHFEYRAFLLMPFSEERWANTMNGFCSFGDWPWALLHKFRHTWILDVWLTGYEILGKSLQLSEPQNSMPPSQSAVCAKWEKVCGTLDQTICSTP